MSRRWEPEGGWEGLDGEELEAARQREEMEHRRSRLGTCRTCGEPVLWARSQWGGNVPLDPIPVVALNDAEFLAGLGFAEPPYPQLFATQGRVRVVSITGAEIYRLHNDGDCIRAHADGVPDEKRSGE